MIIDFENLIIIFLVILLLIIIINTKEKFFNTTNDKFIDYRVIYMKTSNNIDRIQQINDMQNKLGKKINFFDAVVGKEVDLNNLKLYHRDLKFNFNYKYIGEIGCYLSHFMLIKESINSNYEYTVIFEDDFYIRDANFDKDLSKSLELLKEKNVNFDILYLGNIFENKGDHIINNIYSANTTTQLLGTHAYLINNKSASKIVDKLLNMDCAIDHKFSRSNMTNVLDILVFYPSIVKTNEDLVSIIHPETKAF